MASGEALPQQDELRRRLLAARELAGLTSHEQLAEATGWSRTTVKDFATDRRPMTSRHIDVIARACGVPRAWFTVPNLQAALRAALDADSDPSLHERVEALEQRLQAVTAPDHTRRQVREVLDELQIVAIGRHAPSDAATATASVPDLTNYLAEVLGRQAPDDDAERYRAAAAGLLQALREAARADPPTQASSQL